MTEVISVRNFCKKYLGIDLNPFDRLYDLQGVEIELTDEEVKLRKAKPPGFITENPDGFVIDFNTNPSPESIEIKWTDEFEP